MTTNAPASSHSLDTFSAKLRDNGLTRDMAGKMLGGICAGLARRFGLETGLVRILFVVGTLLGVTPLLYAVLFVIFPASTTGRSIFDDARTGRSIKAIVLVALVVLGLISIFTDHPGGWITLAIVAAFGVHHYKRRNAGQVSPSAPGATQPQSPAGPFPTDTADRGAMPVIPTGTPAPPSQDSPR